MPTREELTVRELIEAQNRRLKSRDLRERAFCSFFAYGELGRRLPTLADRQIGQLVWDVVLDDLGLVSPAMSISIEASERLFRSIAGARTTARLNVPGALPTCPQCGEEMMHFIGVGEPDYRQCASLNCEHKIREQYVAGVEEQNR